MLAGGGFNPRREVLAVLAGQTGLEDPTINKKVGSKYGIARTPYLPTITIVWSCPSSFPVYDTQCALVPPSLISSTAKPFTAFDWRSVRGSLSSILLRFFSRLIRDRRWQQKRLNRSHAVYIRLERGTAYAPLLWSMSQLLLHVLRAARNSNADGAAGYVDPDEGYNGMWEDSFGEREVLKQGRWCIYETASEVLQNSKAAGHLFSQTSTIDIYHQWPTSILVPTPTHALIVSKATAASVFFLLHLFSSKRAPALSRI
ncbi:hypothetical protein GALMADRAFT_719231 [Galerina marginata CBS 339.88]|uniref:Uncharacterized protein n=1 Tax=Galerina marginata (strain CBS 339.88) TaxID=685588 RepID=A0A067TZW6_GALM3|nr:hypothetical protein GALMADRAFT_719231 [Galerina marginata CBS 339.88]